MNTPQPNETVATVLDLITRMEKLHFDLDILIGRMPHEKPEVVDHRAMRSVVGAIDALWEMAREYHYADFKLLPPIAGEKPGKGKVRR